ncbi:hypothetical protein C7I55_25810 [Sphingomonas deserti]|uniref:Uncharacterized protein n=1 Tax=Allosphingosinicella deserti TaxID=2116704 RepID=A0A2P7QEU2_9SPHN|nr:hypothetical protein C7I55_25810 [Sphingomonas deserti]
MSISAQFTALRAVTAGFGLGVVLELAGLIIAIASSGAGHGNYVAARALFPAPMLLTLVEGGQIGPFSLALGLLQFPLYGALLVWSASERKTLFPIAVALAHLAAALVCFSGVLSNFS